MALPTKTRAHALVASVAGLALVSPVIHHKEPLTPASSPHALGVVAQWDKIAERTVVIENLTPIPVVPLYLSFTSVAMYDAVVSVKGGFEPYALHRRPRNARNASGPAAVATAAYRVLRHYFPASADNLDANYAAALTRIPDGPREELGITVGEAAARAVIRLRSDDGRDDDRITLDPLLRPGGWRPTPPDHADMLVPWLGFVRPMVLDSPAQVTPEGPRQLPSAAYARELREVRTMGAANSTARTPAQTETALFFTDNSVAQYQAAMRRAAVNRDLPMLARTRMFALVNTATADALIACWKAKYDHAYWRPITAIHRAAHDGNAATSSDPTWTPLAPTPPYPEYPSGHACITGSVTRGLSHLFGQARINLEVESAVTGTTRHYQGAHALNKQSMNARIWLGLHFRTGMVDANQLGQRTAAYVAAHAFRPSPMMLSTP